jgi:hypothetical protein
MNAILESAHTWFFEAAAHRLDGALIIRLVEGIKAPERQVVDTGVAKLGPYFPVRVEPDSRCVEVTFENAIAFLVLSESFNGTDSTLVREPGRFLSTATESSFRSFTRARTLIADLCEEAHREFFLWCEDRVFQVVSTGTPQVAVLGSRPDLALERTETWSAS